MLLFRRKGITPQDAVDIVRKQNAGICVVSCKDYITDFIVTAFLDPDNRMEMDPFYLVDKCTGAVRRYTIAYDPQKYFDTEELEFE